MAGEGARPLSEFVDLVRGTTYSSSRLGEPGPVLLGLGSIQRNGGFRPDNLKTYGGPSAANLLLRPGELYASLKDVTQSADLLGSIARLPAEVPLGRLTQDTVKLKLKPGADCDLIYWTLRTPQYRTYCRAHATGTTNLGLPRNDFLAFPIPEPTADRLALVRLFETLDAKLKLNTLMAETLEAMAQALFKSWFIDFDPVQAKEAGRPTGLPERTADLFPSGFNGNGIPEGWSPEPVLDQAEWVNGAAYKDMHFSDAPDALPVIKIAELKNGVTRTTKRTNTDLGDRYRIQTGELLFSWSGSPETSIDTFIWIDGAAWLNQHIFAVRPNGKATHAYLFAMLKFLKNDLIEIARNKQTTGLGHVTRQDLARIQVHTGDAAVLAAFEATVGTIYERLQAVLKEMHTLPLLRDTLLPKLIPGEMLITDVEAQVSAA